MKQWLVILLTILAVVALLFTLRVHLAGEFRDIKTKHGVYERCHKLGLEIRGAEDIALSRRINTLFVSAMDRRTANAVGGLYTMDPVSLRIQKMKLDGFNFPMFHPHGISVLENEAGVHLFVINHAERHFVDVFKYIDVSTLRFVKRYSFDLFISPNDLVAVSESEFYVTNDHGSSSMLGKTLEDLFLIKAASVVHVKDDVAKIVLDGLAYANGIDVSRPDASLLYLAETTGEAVKVYDRASLRLLSNTDVESGADNFFIDGSDIYVASHPKSFSFVLLALGQFEYSPTQIQRVYKDGNAYKWENIFVDVGNVVSDASIAVITNNRLFIGSVFDKGVLVCNKRA